MDIAALIDLFESYAVRLKAVGHVPDSERERAFFNIDLEDFQDALPRHTKPVSVLLQTPEAEKMNKYDNMAERYDFSFVVLNHKPRARKAAVISEAKAIADKIFNHFLQDASPLDFGTIEGTDEGVFGPVSDGIYGWAIMVAMVHPYNAELNPDDWLAPAEPDEEGGEG